MAGAFVDTSVLVYAFDGASPDKQAVAQHFLVDTEVLVVSAQVLLEFFVAVTRKLNPPVPPDIARAAVAELARLTVVPADASLVRQAVDTSITHELSIWDAMILEAAAEAGCDTIVTEDLSPGLTIRNVRIVNPFST